MLSDLPAIQEKHKLCQKQIFSIQRSTDGEIRYESYWMGFLPITCIPDDMDCYMRGCFYGNLVNPAGGIDFSGMNTG